MMPTDDPRARAAAEDVIRTWRGPSFSATEFTPMWHELADGIVAAMADAVAQAVKERDHAVSTAKLYMDGAVFKVVSEEFARLRVQERFVAEAVQVAVAAERNRAIDLITKRLVYDSQRAVSWHEIQDCLEALRAPGPTA